ncbi:protein argonaute 2-like [Actinidia eriantha]|uniref:protein argonaute 2-like n=1 Tax=Actinidia eriantha TaxID=165200 RepID=UPI00258B20D1|nr:protein argonaute 2-like [Actinidia eriantha]
MERTKCSLETGVTRGRHGGGNRGGRRRNYSHQLYHSGGGRGGWDHPWADQSKGKAVRSTRGGRSGRRVWSEGPIQPQPEFLSQTERVQQAFPVMESLEISEQKPPMALLESMKKRILPMKRPSKGGTLAVSSVWLFANHFRVRFNTESSIMHYHVDIKPHMSPDMQSVNTSIPKSDLRLIVDKVVSDDPTRFPDQMIVYDGKKNMLSAVPLSNSQVTQVTVKLSGGDGIEGRSYIVIIKLVNKLKYSKLQDYLSGKLPYKPRDILQAIDLVMKENPSRHRTYVGRSFYSNEFRAEDDLNFGIAAFRGFQQSPKLTSQGLAICLDSSVMAFHKSLPVIDFLKEHVQGFEGANDVRELRREVTFALKGLKVTVTHCITKQEYIISGLSNQNAREIAFPLQNAESHPPREIGLVEYFRQKYDIEVIYMDIPCLKLEEANGQSYVPMEFCSLVEGQRYPMDKLGRERGKLLKKISMPSPMERKNAICEMQQTEDGPRCNVLQNFGIAVENNMTRLFGRVIGPPKLKLRTSTGEVKAITVDNVKCDWNFVQNSVVEGKPLERWALIDFSKYECDRLNPDAFIPNLIKKCSILGVLVEQPIVCHCTGMREFSSVARIRALLESVVKEANGKCKGRLQLIICVMPEEHHGYNYLKWVSETEIGVLTQCCLTSYANEGTDNYIENLALKINAKLGGSNTELMECFPGFGAEEHAMFVGANVNYPASSSDVRCTSIAAVVATINWPAANRYAARICPQDRRKEQIVNFGSLCLDLVNTYAHINKVKPKKIVVFRGGVSEGQFDMVLNDELLDLQKAIYTENYRPTITLIVAQKRQMTRLFLENGRNGIGNVPPGTVVDTTIVDPSCYDFYLCSHYGTTGTSKPTHYSVLRNEHNFTADQLQKLIYDLCFTYARCTKPVSLVPPICYADLASFRGRQYQDVVMELQLPAPVSKSSSFSGTSSSASLSAALLDPKFYKLHPDLENKMFFV